MTSAQPNNPYLVGRSNAAWTPEQLARAQAAGIAGVPDPRSYPMPTVVLGPPTQRHPSGAWPVQQQPRVVYVPVRAARTSLTTAQIVAIVVGVVLFLAGAGMGIMTILNVT